MKTTMALCLIICLAVPVAFGCNNKANEGGFIEGEVVSVAEMDTTNKTAVVVRVTSSDIVTTNHVTIWMDGGWKIPQEYRKSDINTQIRMAVPCLVTDFEKGNRTFLVVVGQTVCIKAEREADGSLAIAKLGTIFKPGISKDRDGLATVRAALQAKSVDLYVYEMPPASLWNSSMAYPDAKLRTGKADAEWIDFWPWLLLDPAPISIASFLSQ